MTKRVKFMMTLLWALCMTLPAVAQQQPDTMPAGRQERRITPVRPSTNTVLQPGRDMSADMIEHYILGDTLEAQAQARRDSLRKAYTRYPRLTSLWLGANVADLALTAFGQDYASVDVHATLNMWNRLQPTVEVGLGWAKSRPEDMNFTYRGKASPYAKVGVNYNFLFKSEPRYQALLGARLGMARVDYDVTDVTVTNSYWQETSTYDLKGERTTASWGEVLAGIKVGIAGPWALGWMVRWHKMITCKPTAYSRPWYVPGYGKRDNSLAFSFSVYYTLPLHRVSPVAAEAGPPRD